LSSDFLNIVFVFFVIFFLIFVVRIFFFSHPFLSFFQKKKKKPPPLLRNVPVLYTAGNHESSTTPTLVEASFPGIDDGGECAQAYDRLLLQPKPSGEQFY